MPHQRNNDYTAAYPVIWDVTSRYLDNLVVIAGPSGSGQFSAWAFQINQAVRRTEFINDISQLGNGNDLGLGYFGESGHEQDVSSPGDDRLRIDEDNDKTIMELGIAVSPDDFLVIAQNPTQESPIIGNLDTSEQVGGSFALTDPQGNDVVEGGFGGVYSQWTRLTTPTGDMLPTTALGPQPDQGFIKIAEDKNQNHIRVGFRNNSGEDVQPRVAAIGTRYQVVNVDEERVARDMLFGRGMQRRVVQWGALGNDTERTAPDDWTELDVTEDQVRELLANNGGE